MALRSQLHSRRAPSSAPTPAQAGMTFASPGPTARPQSHAEVLMSAAETFDPVSIRSDAFALSQYMRPEDWPEEIRRELVKAGKATGNLTETTPPGMAPGDPVDDPKAIYIDPFGVVQQLGYRERPSALSYQTLSTMVWRLPIVQAIIQTRINQVSAFATPQHYKFETGFRVKMRDTEAKPTAADKKEAKRLEGFVLACGTDSSTTFARDSFETFLRKLTRDSLTYDQINFETVPDRKGRPSYWLAVDAATVRLADSSKLYFNEDPDAVYAVQIYDNVIISEFTRRELAFGVRNARTDIRSYGYGTSELEMTVSTITSLLNSLQYNAMFFSQGTVAKGLLNLKGAIPEKQLRAFRRQWYQQVSGVSNAWRTPITNSEEVQWINMQNSNRDMEFSAYMDFLIKIVCACYTIDPVEINFKYGNSGAQKSMFEGAQKAKAQESRERGLRPLLRTIGRLIDRHILWPLNPDFSIEFVGLEAQTPKEMADLLTQRVRTMYTINEVRAENDMPPLPDGMGDIILDANWMNYHNAKQEQKQQASFGSFVDPNAPGGKKDDLTKLLGGVAPKKPSADGKSPGTSIPAQTEKEMSNEMGGAAVTGDHDVAKAGAVVEFEV